MPEKSLTGKSIKNSYEGLLHLNDGGLAGGTGVTQRKPVYDGLGSTTCLEIASNSLKINGSTQMAGDVNIASGSASVYIRSGSAAIELRDGAGSDNPYIDFKTSGSEDYDCRIIKSSNGLQVWTGGNANRQLAAGFQSDQKLRVYGQILLGKNTGDGFPGVSLDATRVGQLDKLKLYSNDVISLYTAGTAEANARLTVLANGKVGIGTTAPAQTLHVNGSLRLKVGGTEADGKVLTCTNSSGDVAWRNAAASFKFTSGVAYVEAFTNAREFVETSNFFYVLPPSGYTISNLVAFIPSIAVIYFNGTVDQNDALRCGWLKVDNQGNVASNANATKIKVSVQNTEQSRKGAANWLAVWSK